MKQRFYVGTYNQPIVFGTGELVPGKGKGIHILEMDIDTLALGESLPPVDTPNPSYLALHPSKKVLYAVNELKEYEGQPGGSLSAFAIREDGSLKHLNTVPSFGTDPCHLCVSPGGRHLAAANYSSGSVCVYALTADGAPDERTAFVRHAGSGPDKGRQEGPHAHAVIFDPSGKHLLVPDLGIDRLMAYTFHADSGALTPAPAPFYACPPGFGPRTGAFHPDLPVFYCVSELTNSVLALRYEAKTARMAEIQSVPALPGDFNGQSSCADLRVSGDGRFVYVSNRGHDSLMAFAVDRETGRLKSLGAVPVGGRTPRQFTLFHDVLLAGCQDSDRISVFTLDKSTGLPGLASRFDTPCPVCVLPYGEPYA